MVEYNITRLTNNGFDDEKPQIDGNKVVWEGNDQIYFFDGVNTPIQLSNNGLDNQDPQISGTNIVWEGFNPDFFSGIRKEVLLYDGTTTVQTNSQPFEFNNDPQVDGNKVVWEFNGEILLYDGNQTVEITSNSSNENKNPQISGSNLAWVREDDNDSEIMFSDGDTFTTIQITNDFSDDEDPQISGKNIVWEDDDNNRVLFYNGTTQEIIELTNNSIFEGEDPQIDGNYIVFEGYAGQSSDIFLYNIATKETTNITDNFSGDQDPQIDGNIVVWESFDLNGQDKEISLYNIDTKETIQLTNNSFDDEDPDVSEGNIVWEGLVDGQDEEIFLATPKPAGSAVTELAVTEPAVTEPAVTEPAVTEPAAEEPAAEEGPLMEEEDLNVEVGLGYPPIFGTSGIDTIFVEGRGPQLFFGGDGTDLFLATDISLGNNIVYGGRDDDNFTLAANDTFYGGEGDDTFYVQTGGGNFMTGGEGADQFWIAVAGLPDDFNIITDFKQSQGDVIGIARVEGVNSFEDLELIKTNTNGILNTSVAINDILIAFIPGVDISDASAFEIIPV
ncbi:MAG: hypothetical protein QNJ65_05325 [Xenococcaceae cyanobacterium MO_234.B1]|nr:hypothetical protein [Xenococcaceae cyanobacterium MO_234.B1]